MNISRRERILLILTIYLMLVFLFYQFLYAPLNQKVSNLKQENTRLAGQKSDLERISQERRKRQVELNKLVAENKQMEHKIPREKEMVGLLNELQQAANQAGVKLISIEYRMGDASQNGDNNTNPNTNAIVQKTVNSVQANLPAPVPARKPLLQVNGQKLKGVQVLSLSIGAAGGYDQLRNYLWLVERSQRMINIEQCSLLAESKQTAADGATASAGSSPSGAGKDQPPPAPVAKGERNSDRDGENAADAAAPASVKARDRYDMNNMQMKLQINTFYSQ